MNYYLKFDQDPMSNPVGIVRAVCARMADTPAALLTEATKRVAKPSKSMLSGLKPYPVLA
jgi:hypothetical protein